MAPSQKSDLSRARRLLLELMQDIHFGRITKFQVCDGEPVFSSNTLIEREIKLGSPNVTRLEKDMHDFALKQEVVSLFEHLSQMRNGVVSLLEIKHGLPFLMRVAHLAT